MASGRKLSFDAVMCVILRVKVLGDAVFAVRDLDASGAGILLEVHSTDLIRLSIQLQRPITRGSADVTHVFQSGSVEQLVPGRCQASFSKGFSATPVRRRRRTNTMVMKVMRLKTTGRTRFLTLTRILLFGQERTLLFFVQPRLLVGGKVKAVHKAFSFLP